ncbi:MAG: polyphosphate kinase 2 family protein [Acetobacteraceae bacterium]|nr:polyphosphate kinase 2 family protein [Acetobacteraceae bacterium]
MSSDAPLADSLHLSPKRVRKLLEPYRIEDGKGFRLKHHDPSDTAGRLLEKPDAAALLAEGVHVLAQLQEKLYAQDRWAMLCAFQAMDAAGKDGTIKHVMSGVNPQGVQVTSFKAPGTEELAHDFLWRSVRALPQRGHIGIFNRSHYEEVLVVRVHPEMLEHQHLPPEMVGKRIWQQRLEAIANLEQYLARQGTVVLKFFLNVSKGEQRRRFLERLDDPGKHWKFSPNDLAERAFWDDYQDAYEEVIAATAAPHAPWFVVPADNKWFTRLIVVAAMVDALHRLDLTMPPPTPAQESAWDEARKALDDEK